MEKLVGNIKLLMNQKIEPGLADRFHSIRNEFPAISQSVNNKPLVYLDSAATALKPKVVSDRIYQFYLKETANVHRGAHYLADQATQEFEEVRNKIMKFLNAKVSSEIIFTKGTTESINVAANSFADQFCIEGDEVIISEIEHHANIVPWQMVCTRKKIKLKVLKVTEQGEFDLDHLSKLLSSKTKIVAVTACSNTLGNIPELTKLIQLSHQAGAKVLIDAAQLITFKKVDVQKLDCDFLVFSMHKLFGPYGVGVLYGKKELLDKLPPYQGGGSMISKVTFEKTTYNDIPYRFEGGTPNISGVIASGVAIDFVNSIGLDKIHNWESYLVKTAIDNLKQIKDIEILYPELADRGPLVSFNLKGAHHSDVGQILNEQGIAVRAGHHCTQPLMDKFNLTGTVRASFSIYNNEEDVGRFIQAVQKAREMLL